MCHTPITAYKINGDSASWIRITWSYNRSELTSTCMATEDILNGEGWEIMENHWKVIGLEYIVSTYIIIRVTNNFKFMEIDY